MNFNGLLELTDKSNKTRLNVSVTHGQEEKEEAESDL